MRIATTKPKTEAAPKAGKTWNGHPVYTEKDCKSMKLDMAQEKEWVAKLLAKRKKKKA